MYESINMFICMIMISYVNVTEYPSLSSILGSKDWIDFPMSDQNPDSTALIIYPSLITITKIYLASQTNSSDLT